MGPLNQCKGLCDRWNTDPSFTVWGPMQLSHLSWVIHLQWISPLSSSLQEHKEEEKTSNFHGSSQPTRAVPGQRHVCTISIRRNPRVVRCSAPRDLTQPLYNQHSPRQESHFPHGEWPTGPWQWAARDISMWQVTGRRATFLCFVDQVCKSIGPDSFKQFHQDLGLPSVKSTIGSCVRVASPKKELLSVLILSDRCYSKPAVQ